VVLVDQEYVSDTRFGPVVVVLPQEIDISNARQVGDQLRAAFAPGVLVVVADGSLTQFCDSSGVRELVLVYKHAAASHAELRMASQSHGLLRVLGLLGFDRLVRVYPTVADALAGLPLRLA
jgi:anti-sigma B factor antagonist